MLHLLCLRGHTEAVRWLLSRKLVTDINATNAHGDTALHYGTHTHTPFSPPPPGMSPRKSAPFAVWTLTRMEMARCDGVASRKGHGQIVDLLLAHGASPAHQGEFGTPPQVHV